MARVKTRYSVYEQTLDRTRRYQNCVQQHASSRTRNKPWTEPRGTWNRVQEHTLDRTKRYKEKKARRDTVTMFGVVRM